MRERETPCLRADFLCSRTKPDARARIYAALAQRECAHLKCVSRSSVCACSNFVLCTRTSLRALELDINYFHTWIKSYQQSDFSMTDQMKILGLLEEGTDPGISLQFNNI